MRSIRALVILVVLVLIGGFLILVRENTNLSPVLLPPPEDITKILDTTHSTDLGQAGMPLALPAGFSIEIFAKDLPGARVMAFDQFGNLWVSEMREGQIILLEIQNGKPVHRAAVLKGLKNPHGLVFDPKAPSLLYVAEEDKLSKLHTYSDGGIEEVLELPWGGNHVTRTLGWVPGAEGKKLLISVGSTCNVCREQDTRRGAMLVFDLDTKVPEEFARGLRNTVFFTNGPDGKIWGTDMGRDLLGDDLPPDEVNIIEQGKNYAWPNCYGKNIHDTDFDKNTYIRNPCLEPFEIPSYIDIPAHSAPLGLAFVPPAGGWPKDYEGDLLVAYHGSWNRSVPTGYKVVRMKLGENGKYESTEDFITGWLTKDGALGRPVDLKFGPDGALYISDDKVGVVYRVTYRGE